MTDETTWEFTDPVEAREYLEELARVWGTWALGLVLVLLTQGVALLVVSVALMVAIVAFSRPFQRRARELSDGEGDRIVGSWVQVAIGRGFERDRIARDLLYREPPMLAAMEAAGVSTVWIWARRALIVATIATLIVVWADVFSGTR